jgi:hypothetical protein
MNRGATSSLPVPVSPAMRIVLRDWATSLAVRTTSMIALLRPTIP